MGLRFAPGVQDFVKSLAPEPKRRIREALRRIAEDARHPDLDARVMRKSGPIRFFRARVGDYRIVYAPVGRDTYVWRVLHRSEGYEWFERLDPVMGEPRTEDQAEE